LISESAALATGFINMEPSNSVVVTELTIRVFIFIILLFFKTILESPTDKKVGWKVIFNNMVNQNWGPYDRDSWNPVYGNQLFM
ncbi:leukocidin family pore-forming toxin, partial [Staphylococcus aureus]|uniref:leukocidin family pore-forming toxin n=1 Tax=Staphylococcus aureus TaxID=1280 RepID=UPI001FAFF730